MIHMASVSATAAGFSDFDILAVEEATWVITTACQVTSPNKCFFSQFCCLRLDKCNYSWIYTH